jgi:hypothetical protein
MKTGTALATALFALASFPLLAQQPPQAPQPNSPQQNPPETQPASPGNAAASPETPAPEASAVEMRPVNGELVSKLDSKTAKAGDNVVIQIKSSAKTADGIEIPKGSKLIGHVMVAQPSAAGTNSQVVLQFDHIELKDGQSVAVSSQIQSITPAEGAASAGGSAPMPGSPAPATGPSNPGASRANGAQPSAASDPGAAARTGDSGPAPGTVVAKNGNIAISTTSIPGVLLANNAPGQQDPRMAQASSILLGAKKDIQLDGGTQMVVGVSATGKGTR